MGQPLRRVQAWRLAEVCQRRARHRSRRGSAALLGADPRGRPGASLDLDAITSFVHRSARTQI
jgi:hypothetical protein